MFNIFYFSFVEMYIILCHNYVILLFNKYPTASSLMFTHICFFLLPNVQCLMHLKGRISSLRCEVVYYYREICNLLVNELK